MIVETPTPSWTVYAHIAPNGKMYVGITSQKPEHRWRDGVTGYRENEHFCNAIKKYGWDNFQHEIIASGLTADEASNMEKLLIQKLDLTNRNNGYNKSYGGDGANRSPATPETKRKMHDHMMRRIANNGGYGLNKGKHFSELARQHNRDAQKRIADIHRDSRLGAKLSQESISKRTAKRLENNGGVYTKNTTAKQVRCVETNCLFPSVRVATNQIGVSPYILKRRIQTGDSINGFHYEYVDKGELLYGT